MTDLTPEDRARALELHRLYRELLSSGPVRTWVAMEKHIRASHTCPDPESDSRVKAWGHIAQHPFFADCYQTEGTLIEAMLAKLDAAHNHTCGPVWRPVTREEIQPGWEVRARRRNGSEAGWGVAHHRDDEGDWLTGAGDMLTWAAAGWTYETTAPLPEPEPWPDELVDALADTIGTTTGTTWEDDARAVLDLLAAKFPGVRAAIAGGEQS